MYLNMNVPCILKNTQCILCIFKIPDVDSSQFFLTSCFFPSPIKYLKPFPNGWRENRLNKKRYVSTALYTNPRSPFIIVLSVQDICSIAVTRSVPDGLPYSPFLVCSSSIPKANRRLICSKPPDSFFPGYRLLLNGSYAVTGHFLRS